MEKDTGLLMLNRIWEVEVTAYDSHLLYLALHPLPSLGHIWDVMLVWSEGNINRTVSGLQSQYKQEVKVIWQKAPHGGPIPRLGVTPGGRKLYHWIPGVGFPISVPQ